MPILTPTSNENFQLNVYNVNGQLMKSIEDYKTTDLIGVKEMHKGLYILRISNNKYTYSAMIIILQIIIVLQCVD